MLALGRAIMADPYLVCLDEPSLGLAPMVVQDIFRTIKAINAAGTSVLLVEQNARYALETASRGYVLQTGSIIASGARVALRQDERVREAYLGRAASARLAGVAMAPETAVLCLPAKGGSLAARGPPSVPGSP